MDVEIDDGDPLGAVFALRLAGHDGDGVDEAEAHRRLALGVVAGRAHGAEGVLGLAQRDRIERGEAGTEGGADGVERGRRR